MYLTSQLKCITNNSVWQVNFMLDRRKNMWIYTPYITRKGRRIYASSYGLKVFKFWVDEDKIRK